MRLLVKKRPLILRRGALHLGALLVVTLATWRTVSTYTVLSHTVDEPTHISSGLEWLERGTQRLHPENPPLGRIGAGLGAYLADHTLPPSGTAPQRGTELLYAEGDYLRNLTYARLGTLPFFLLTVLLVWNWVNQIAGARAALLATVSLCSIPALLGHAGLATTDVPFVAMFLLALWVYIGWLDTPTIGRALLLGLTLGLGVATKFSTLVFFPPCALAILLVWRVSPEKDGAASARPDWARMILGMVLALPLAGLVVWGAYRFSFGAVDEIPGAERVIEVAFPDDDSLGRRIVESISHRPVPAPNALYGLYFLKAHTVQGHSSYLLGREKQNGFWYFYPVALAVKTPLTAVLLMIVGLVGLLRQKDRGRWTSLAAPAAAAAVLLVSMLSTINIGLRHILVIYPLLAVGIGLGLDALLDSVGGLRGRLVALGVGLLLVWHASLAFRAYPDFLAYFNPLAGGEPGRVLVDSDLDWGQDVLQLESALAGMNVPLLNIAYFGSVRLCEHQLPRLRWLLPGQPVSGWVAISEMYFRDHWHLGYEDVCDRTHARQVSEGASYDWLRRYEPVAIAGRSIRVYHLADE